MRIICVNESVKKQLRKSGISKLMKSLESCEWLVIEEFENRIVGAAGIGGLFHVSGIQIIAEFQGKGIGKKLQKTVIDEARRRGYSFITVFNDPRNTRSANLHDSLGYVKIFRIHYAPDIVNDVKAIVFNKWGKIVINSLRLFNSKIGIFFLACLLKIFKFTFPNMILYNEDNLRGPNIKWILKNFEKI